jgi:hypothetical protein
VCLDLAHEFVPLPARQVAQRVVQIGQVSVD